MTLTLILENGGNLVFDHHEPSCDHRAIPRDQPLRRRPAADARVFPDYPAPVVRDDGGVREMVTMRWGNETARRFTPAGLFLLGRLLVPNTLMNLRSWNGAGFNSLVDGG
jgi:hypothetical protein